MSFYKLKEQLKDKYIDFGKSLLVWTLNPINSFARHLIVLQGKDPDAIPVFKKAASDIRPSFNFGGSSRGWSKDHFKNPEKYHPILLGRVSLDKNKILNVVEDSKATTAAIEAAFQVSIGPLTEIQPKDNLDQKKVVKVKRFKKGVFRRVGN